MSLSIKPALLAAALLPGAAAVAQDGPDQALYGTRIERPSLEIPDEPPCVDGALVGRLRPTGERERAQLSASYRSTRYGFEFTPRRTLFGPAPPPTIHFWIFGNPHLPDRDNAVLLVRREPDGTLVEVYSELAIRDWRGREFIPLLWPPIPQLRGASWLPIGFEAFMRPVHYDRRQMEAHGHDSVLLRNIAGARERTGWLEWRGERAVVRYGLYLDELEAMFALQKPDQCRRPDPRLANPGLSR